MPTAASICVWNYRIPNLEHGVRTYGILQMIKYKYDRSGLFFFTYLPCMPLMGPANRRLGSTDTLFIIRIPIALYQKLLLLFCKNFIVKNIFLCLRVLASVSTNNFRQAWW